MDENDLQEIVDRAATKRDQSYYIISGAFLARFSHVEMMLTAIIAAICNMRDLKSFQVLTKGMDTRVKIERLKLLAKNKHGTIGPVLKGRLDILENQMVPTRNDLAHGALWGNQKEPGKWHVLTIESFQLANFQDDGLDKAPRFYRAEDLSAKARWCELLHRELGQVFRQAADQQPLEITHPLMKAPTDIPSDRAQPKRPASPNKRTKKPPSGSQ